jgi:hypothetical protein
VRIAVATLVSTPLMPTLAKMAVSAANTDERSAYIHHIVISYQLSVISYQLSVISYQLELAMVYCVLLNTINELITGDK